MLESKETGNISSLDINNILSYWQPVNKDSILKETLDTFFPNGAIYKDKILLSRFFSTSDSVTHSGEGISVIGARDNDETRTFYVYVKKYSQVLDNGFVIYWNLPNGDPAFHLDFSDPPQITDEGYITILSSNWDSSNNVFTFSFTLNAAIGGGLSLEAVNNNDDYWLVEQYEVTADEGQTIQVDHATLPTMDCSDFASFIWAASKGKIIKNKLFDCQNLINENYDFVQEVEKISPGGHVPRPHPVGRSRYSSPISGPVLLARKHQSHATPSHPSSHRHTCHAVPTNS
jgi:hypothetical protein